MNVIKTDPYTRSLGQGSLVGSAVRIWRSKDLIDWQYLGAPFSLQDTAHYQENPDSIFRDKRRKIAGKYVHFGTAWSTDLMRKGFYNLYYCTADQITGPYGPRKFAGRFLGHGTPFQTRDGKWSCTAFFNANVPPLPREGIETRDLSEDAQTINQRGTTIVPLEVEILNDGDITIQAKDPAYATPGPDEAQQF